MIPFAVVGAGLSGMSVALALARAGCEVILIDQHSEAELLGHDDGRCSSIAWSGKQFFSVLAIWDALAPYAQPINDIRVAQQGSRAFVHFSPRLGSSVDSSSVEPMGYMVANSHLKATLLAAVRAEPAITFQAETLLADPPFLVRKDAAYLQCVSGEEIPTSLIIAADGHHSALRMAAGIPVYSSDYHQTAITCVIEHQRSHLATAHECFMTTGPLAMLPLHHDPGQSYCSSLVWTVPDRYVPSLLEQDDAAFGRLLGSYFGDYLGDLCPRGNRWAYPLGLAWTHDPTHDRLVLIGESAHRLHPLAGQGFNLTLGDIISLVERVGGAADPGRSELLKRYARDRLGSVLTMVFATDALNQLFSIRGACMRLVRAGGLACVNHLSPIKRAFMNRAMGRNQF